MAYDCKQLEFLITRVLQEYNLYSNSALNLLLGTCAVESGFGTYMRQINGPALGAFQMERPTYQWLKNEFHNKYPDIKERKFCELEWDLKLAIIFARLRYRVDPEPLPESWDIGGMAYYWKRVYNTMKGKRKEEDFIFAYNNYVKEKEV